MSEPAFQDPTPRPLFGDHDYELSYAPRPGGLEVRIRGRRATAPAVGDVYTLDRSQVIHDVVVTEVRREGPGPWSARCSVRVTT
jgi:hypothetical protein